MHFPTERADECPVGAAATISKQHRATSSAIGSASPPEASWMDISAGREEYGGRDDARSHDYRRLTSAAG